MITGIHHVTAIAGDAQTNMDFYAGVLGLRLVKKTVNFDDPGTYHLYYGDGLGRPGTILTFFPWPNARKGRVGSGQTTAIDLTIPAGSTGYWRERLTAHRVSVETPTGTILIADPDGIRLFLIEADEDFGDGSGSGTVPAEYAIRGIGQLHLNVTDLEASAHLLTEVMGWHRHLDFYFQPQAGIRQGRLLVMGEDLAQKERGTTGVGTIHHVAFRVADDETQLKWRAKLEEAGVHVSRVMDREYFHSIYFREPGGVLFEIATDPPGFTADEPLETLGTHLKLPSWLESSRSQIEAKLSVLHPPRPTFSEEHPPPAPPSQAKEGRQ